jgi:CTD kinase subunit gamma
MLNIEQVLHALQAKAILLPETVNELDAVLKSREVEHPFTAEPSNTTAAATSKSARLDKRQIEHRIEEDRERHKRLRESIWAVPGDDEHEMDRLWDEASDVGDDDYVIGREDSDERAQAIALG